MYEFIVDEMICGEHSLRFDEVVWCDKCNSIFTMELFAKTLLFSQASAHGKHSQIELKGVYFIVFRRCTDAPAAVDHKIINYIVN